MIDFGEVRNLQKKRKMQEKIKINVQKRKIQGIEFARNEICKEWKLQKNEICT